MVKFGHAAQRCPLMASNDWELAWRYWRWIVIMKNVVVHCCWLRTIIWNKNVVHCYQTLPYSTSRRPLFDFGSRTEIGKKSDLQPYDNFYDHFCMQTYSTNSKNNQLHTMWIQSSAGPEIGLVWHRYLKYHAVYRHQTVYIALLKPLWLFYLIYWLCRQHSMAVGWAVASS